MVSTPRAAAPAERERRADDERETADFVRDGAGFIQVVRGAGNRNVEADGKHQILEDLAVFALLDGLGFGADHFNAVLFQDTGAVQGHRGVQSGLAAERGQKHKFIWNCRRDAGSTLNRHAQASHFVEFAHDDFFDALGRDGFDVSAVGELRVGHDGGRVGVDEDDTVTFFTEGFAGLRAGIIELARLADDNRSGADDEH